MSNDVNETMAAGAQFSGEAFPPEPPEEHIEAQNEVEAPDVQPDELESDSESDVADAIARAIAEQFEDEDGDESGEEEPQAEVQSTTPPQPNNLQSEAPQKENPRNNKPQREKPSETIKQKVAAEKNPPKESAPGVEVKNPGTDYKKIGRSSVRISPREYFASSFSGIIERQREALPPYGVELKARERTLSAKTGIDRVFNPIRWMIFVLMLLCLAGRKYSWMTLGFMEGIQGTYVSLLLTVVAMVVCWQSTYRSIRDIFYLRFSHESYLLLATLLTWWKR